MLLWGKVEQRERPEVRTTPNVDWWPKCGTCAPNPGVRMQNDMWRNCTLCWNFASICLPHFDWTLAQTSNCHPVGPTVRLSVNCWTDTAGRCYSIHPTAPTWVPRTSTCSQNWKSTCMVCISLRWRTYLPLLPDVSDSSTVLQTWRVSWTFQNVGIQSFDRRETTLKDYNTFPHIWCSILKVPCSVHFFWDGRHTFRSANEWFYSGNGASHKRFCVYACVQACVFTHSPAHYQFDSLSPFIYQCKLPSCRSAFNSHWSVWML